MLFGFSHECSNIMIDAIDGTQGLVLYGAILEFQDKDKSLDTANIWVYALHPSKMGGGGGGG